MLPLLSSSPSAWQGIVWRRLTPRPRHCYFSLDRPLSIGSTRLHIQPAMDPRHFHMNVRPPVHIHSASATGPYPQCTPPRRTDSKKGMELPGPRIWGLGPARLDARSRGHDAAGTRARSVSRSVRRGSTLRLRPSSPQGEANRLFRSTLGLWSSFPAGYALAWPLLLSSGSTHATSEAAATPTPLHSSLVRRPRCGGGIAARTRGEGGCCSSYCAQVVRSSWSHGSGSRRP
jgi:hypothetical protein